VLFSVFLLAVELVAIITVSDLCLHIPTKLRRQASTFPSQSYAAAMAVVIGCTRALGSRIMGRCRNPAR